MTANVGSLDRIIRLIIGVALIALPIIVGFGSTLLTIISVVIGLVMLAVSATRICPLYTILGVRTCRT